MTRVPKRLIYIVTLFPTPDETGNTQRYYGIHSVLLPVCTVAAAVKAMCKCCGTVFHAIQILIHSVFF
jgi:hypothetical protein